MSPAARSARTPAWFRCWYGRNESAPHRDRSRALANRSPRRRRARAAKIPKSTISLLRLAHRALRSAAAQRVRGAQIAQLLERGAEDRRRLRCQVRLIERLETGAHGANLRILGIECAQLRARGRDRGVIARV